MGRSHRLPFRTADDKESRQPGEYIHSDVIGPMPVESLGGTRFFVTFKDDVSGFRHIHFLRHKSDVPERYKEFARMVATKFGRPPRVLHTDNGTEYCNAEMKKFLVAQGTNLQTTAPYTPEQNGKAERDNRTIVESARTMLHASKLPQALWAEARNYRRMAKKFALIKWCGGDDDKTYTAGIPIEWIRGFDYTEYQKETFDVTEVFAIEWRDTKKPPKGGWKLYDAYIIAVSDDCKVLTRRMRLLDGSISPIKNASILKPDQGNIDENNSNKPKKKAITSLKLSSLPLAKKLKTVDSKAVTNITGSSKQSKPSRPDPKSNSVHNVSGVQESGARRYILSDSEDDNITELPSGSNASAVTMEDENSSAKSDVSEGTKTDAEDTVAGKSSADSHDSQKLVTKSTKENQQPEGTSFNNKPVSLEDLMNKLVTMDEKIEDILQNLGGKKGKATVRPSAVTSGIINTKFLENSAFIEGNIEIGDPGSGVTVTDLQWSSAISKTSYTAMAISLLMSLFPLDVLHRSNYKGGASKVGKHVDENVGRNYAALDERIIGAMKHAVLSKFPDKYNESGFGQAINGKLSSLRSKLHKK